MMDKVRDDRWMRRLAFPASIVLHLLIAALLMFGLPQSLPEPQNEEAISVELVLPPEPSRNGRNEPYPVLQPVFQFGEKDAGPQVSPDGNSPNDTSGSPTALRDLDKSDHAQPSAVTTVRAEDAVPRLRTHEPPAPVPEDDAKAQRASKLRQAKTLFSQRATGNPVATIAMRYAPRDVRVARLCATELTEQLRHASPSYFAEIVPFDRLKEGTLVESYSAAFRSNWEWYNLSYRCEVDTEATKVVSFAFSIGAPLTSEEWRRRGCPPNNC
jgi:hypothetical protein